MLYTKTGHVRCQETEKHMVLRKKQKFLQHASKTVQLRID